LTLVFSSYYNQECSGHERFDAIRSTFWYLVQRCPCKILPVGMNWVWRQTRIDLPDLTATLCRSFIEEKRLCCQKDQIWKLSPHQWLLCNSSRLSNRLGNRRKTGISQLW